MKSMTALSLAFLFVCATAAAEKPKSDVITLFNGKDLTGWEGRDDLWSVEDGAIVGRTTKENPIKTNTFLVWQEDQPANFELSLQYKIEGGNSGIQYRSKVINEKEFFVGGYQADIDATNKFAGILYEERGRGILAQRGEKVTIDADGKKSKKRFAESAALAAGIHPDKWNDYRLVADGNHLQHFINGTMTAEVIDDEKGKAAAKGVIAFQIHVGPPMVIRFKNVTMKKLK